MTVVAGIDMESNYTYEVCENEYGVGVLIIEDLGIGGVSIKENLSNIINDLEKLMDIDGMTIIYKDNREKYFGVTVKPHGTELYELNNTINIKDKLEIVALTESMYEDTIGKLNNM